MMDPVAASRAQSLLIAGYVLCFIVVNVVTFLIAVFYRKKLQQPSPRWGFIAAIALAILYCALLLSGRTQTGTLFVVERISITAGVIASALSTVNLFYIMRRVRK
jgi:hypothetical protein